MGKTTSRFETISRSILIAISVLFGIFLISLGNKILNDVTKIFKSPEIQDFYPADSLDLINIELVKVNDTIKTLSEETDRLRAGMESAQSRYQSEKESLEAWIKTRKTIGSPDQDKKVLSRTKDLDKVRLIRDEWNHKVDRVSNQVRELELTKNQLADSKNELEKKSRETFQTAYKSYNLKVFLIRLLIAIPILLLGLYFLIKYRKSKYRSFVWGYYLFSLYIFFIGLVPYFPSYGGYVRYSIGIILTFVIGYYVIKQLAAYRDRIQSELSKSTEERSKNIEYDNAIKGFELHSCPSCERSFQIIENTINKNPNYCTHCGLQLFEECSSCGQRNFSHFSHCSGCGKSISLKKV